jgi:hypothetical protein
MKSIILVPRDRNFNLGSLSGFKVKVMLGLGFDLIMVYPF